MGGYNPTTLIPAERNWRAAFVNPGTKNIFECIVVAWSLCQKDGELNQVSGIVHWEGKMIPVLECPNFIGYLEPHVTSEQFLRKMNVAKT